MGRAILAAAAAFLAAFLAVQPWADAQAPEAFAVSPTDVSVLDAQPSTTYERTVTVQNRLDSASTITIDFQDEAGQWVSATPASGFQMAPRSNRDVVLRMQVPANAGIGNHPGVVAFTTEAKPGPQPIRWGAAVHFNATVGGQANAKLVWVDASARNVAPQQEPEVSVTLRNEGNVRATGKVGAQVLAFATDDVLATGTGEAALDPGQSRTFRLHFDHGLPLGQYRARVRSTDPAGFEKMLEFKVSPAGITPPAAELVAIHNDAFATQGKLVRIDALVENTGTVRIAQAHFKGEIRKGGALVDTLTSEDLGVDPNGTINLTMYWKPPGPGVFVIRGHVTYDGYQTVDSESQVNVRGAFGSTLPWVLGGAGVLVVAGGVVWFVVAWRRRKRKRQPPSTGAQRLRELRGRAP